MRGGANDQRVKPDLLDCVLTSRALCKHCKEAETTEQIDMIGDHKAVIVRIKLPIDHKTQQIKHRTKNREARKKRRQAPSNSQERCVRNLRRHNDGW